MKDFEYIADRFLSNFEKIGKIQQNEVQLRNNEV